MYNTRQILLGHPLGCVDFEFKWKHLGSCFHGCLRHTQYYKDPQDHGLRAGGRRGAGLRHLLGLRGRRTGSRRGPVARG
ncbi:unnamed protein product, partial [Heterosigma akashiwo]